MTIEMLEKNLDGKLDRFDLPIDSLTLTSVFLLFSLSPSPATCHRQSSYLGFQIALSGEGHMGDRIGERIDLLLDSENTAAAFEISRRLGCCLNDSGTRR